MSDRSERLASEPRQRSDYDYELPAAQIAQHPVTPRESARLLHVANAGQPTVDAVQHLLIRDFVSLLSPDDLLVVNNTQVLKARLYGEKDTGGAAELLLERLETDREGLFQVKVSKALQPGRYVRVGEHKLEVVARSGAFYRLRADNKLTELLSALGEVPLPPYVERKPELADESSYQTVFARQPGAVAAPTAGLHFTPALLEQLSSLGVRTTEVTLHVGAGTFSPMRVENIADHQMHFERVEVPQPAVDEIRRCRTRGGRVIAVGTTVVRSLEAAAANRSGPLDVYTGETNLFITPGYEFRVVDALLTNFHLPQSTLLMLVCAFAGYERTMAAYRIAVESGYRFFSYGDAMFLSCATNRETT